MGKIISFLIVAGVIGYKFYYLPNYKIDYTGKSEAFKECIKEYKKGLGRHNTAALNQFSVPYCDCVVEETERAISGNNDPRMSLIARIARTCFGEGLLVHTTEPLDIKVEQDRTVIKDSCFTAYRAISSGFKVKESEHEVFQSFCMCAAPRMERLIEAKVPEFKFDAGIRKIAKRCNRKLVKFIGTPGERE